MKEAPALTAPLSGVMKRYSAASAEEGKRKPGRPKKRTDEYLRGLLDTHRNVEVWYLATYSRRAPSEREMYTAFFAAQFSFEGQRAARATTPEFQRSLKTLRNELAEARRLQRTCPENPAISGT